MVFILAFLNPVSLDVTHICGALMFASLTSEHKFGQINWNKGKEILDMKAIMTVTCFLGKNSQFLPLPATLKGKKNGIKGRLQCPAVLAHQHV